MQVGGGIKIVTHTGAVTNTFTFIEFKALCGVIDSIEIISVGSSSALIIRVKLQDKYYERTNFILRSDVISMSGKPLTVKSFAADTGQIISSLIFKMFIIQPDEVLDELDPFEGHHEKNTVSMKDAQQEFRSHQQMYNETKHFQYPICPNTLGFYAFDRYNYDRLFKNPIKRHPVIAYLLYQYRALPALRHIGILVMESVPSNYTTLLDYQESTGFAYQAYNNMCALTSAIYCILFAVVGIIPIDPHLRNWMCAILNTTERDVDVDILALDPGRIVNVLQRTSQGLVEYDQASILKLSEHVIKYLTGKNIASIDPKSIPSLPLLGAEVKTNPVLQQYGIVSDIELCIRTNTLGGFIQGTIQAINSNPDILFPTDHRSTADNFVVTDNLMHIHLLLMLGACADCLTNYTMYNGDGVAGDVCQFSSVLDQVYDNNDSDGAESHFDNMDAIFTHLSFDLNTYLSTRSIVQQRNIINNLRRISAYIQQRMTHRTARFAGGANHKAITRRRYRTNRYHHHRRSKKGKKSLKYLKRKCRR